MNFTNSTYKLKAHSFRKETGMSTAQVATLINRTRVWTSHFVNGHLKDQNNLTLLIPSISIQTGIDVRILYKYAYGLDVNMTIEDMDRLGCYTESSLSILATKVKELENKIIEIIG